MDAPSTTSKTSPWLPISLLAFSTVAMAGPVWMFRRYRANALKSTTGAPPRRQSGSTALPTKMVPRPRTGVTPPRLVGAGKEMGPKLFSASDTLKAFVIATGAVTVGAVGTVYGVKTMVGVDSTKEFADRMREVLHEKMPVLASRLHRRPDDRPLPPPSGEAWTWDKAEKRLGEAYESGGVSQWAQVALEEMEREEVESSRH